MKHEIRQDLIRVASELGRAPKRDEYHREGLGKFSEKQIRKEFGTFGLALNATFSTEEISPSASDHTKSVMKKLEREQTKYDKLDSFKKHFETDITPWVGKFKKDHPSDLLIMIRSDDHSMWVDPFLDAVFWDVAMRAGPTHIVFAGDQWDAPQISKHGKNPRRLMALQSEVNFVKKKFFEIARTVCPKAQIDWILGNHELRLFRYLCDEAQALSSLENLQFGKIFDLDSYGVNLVARPNFLIPSPKERENYSIYGDCFVVSHGTSCGRQPAMNELDRYGMSGNSGHVHRFTTAFKRDLRGYKRWISNGAMCVLKSGEEYIPDLINWSQGFTMAHIRNGQVYQEHFDGSQDFLCIGGVYYFRKDYIKTSPRFDLALPEV